MRRYYLVVQHYDERGTYARRVVATYKSLTDAERLASGYPEATVYKVVAKREYKNGKTKDFNTMADTGKGEA